MIILFYCYTSYPRLHTTPHPLFIPASVLYQSPTVSNIHHSNFTHTHQHIIKAFQSPAILPTSNPKCSTIKILITVPSNFFPINYARSPTLPHRIISQGPPLAFPPNNSRQNTQKTPNRVTDPRRLAVPTNPARRFIQRNPE